MIIKNFLASLDQDSAFLQKEDLQRISDIWTRKYDKKGTGFVPLYCVRNLVMEIPKPLGLDGIKSKRKMLLCIREDLRRSCLYHAQSKYNAEILKSDQPELSGVFSVSYIFHVLRNLEAKLVLLIQSKRKHPENHTATDKRNSVPRNSNAMEQKDEVAAQTAQNNLQSKSDIGNDIELSCDPKLFLSLKCEEKSLETKNQDNVSEGNLDDSGGASSATAAAAEKEDDSSLHKVHTKAAIDFPLENSVFNTDDDKADCNNENFFPPGHSVGNLLADETRFAKNKVDEAPDLMVKKGLIDSHQSMAGTLSLSVTRVAIVDLVSPGTEFQDGAPSLELDRISAKSNEVVESQYVAEESSLSATQSDYRSQQTSTFRANLRKNSGLEHQNSSHFVPKCDVTIPSNHLQSMNKDTAFLEVGPVAFTEDQNLLCDVGDFLLRMSTYFILPVVVALKWIVSLFLNRRARQIHKVHQIRFDKFVNTVIYWNQEQNIVPVHLIDNRKLYDEGIVRLAARDIVIAFLRGLLGRRRLKKSVKGVREYPQTSAETSEMDILGSSEINRSDVMSTDLESVKKHIDLILQYGYGRNLRMAANQRGHELLSVSSILSLNVSQAVEILDDDNIRIILDFVLARHRQKGLLETQLTAIASAKTKLEEIDLEKEGLMSELHLLQDSTQNLKKEQDRLKSKENLHQGHNADSTKQIMLTQQKQNVENSGGADGSSQFRSEKKDETSPLDAVHSCSHRLVEAESQHDFEAHSLLETGEPEKKIEKKYLSSNQIENEILRRLV